MATPSRSHARHRNVVETDPSLQEKEPAGSAVHSELCWTSWACLIISRLGLWRMMGNRGSGVQGGEQAGPAPPSQAQLAQAQRNKEENEDTTLDDSKFDEFMGNDAGALANTGEYDQDDKDADDVWSQIDSHMDNRRLGPLLYHPPPL